MRISEIFYSLQGEGPTTGKPAVFIRSSFCNLNCSGLWECDTKALLGKGKEYTPESLLHYLKELGLLKRIQDKEARLVLTGGEPCLRSNAQFFNQFLDLFGDVQPLTELETNGTLIDPELFDRVTQINCSPKLKSSGVEKTIRIRPFILKQLNKYEKTNFKFVVGNSDDILEILEYIKLLSIPKRKVYLMPAAETKKELQQNLPSIWGVCESLGFNLSTRLHISAFDKRTGV